MPREPDRSTFGRIYRRPRFVLGPDHKPLRGPDGKPIRDGYAPGYYVRFRYNRSEVTRWAGPTRKIAAELLARLYRESSREELLDEKATASVPFAETEKDFREYLTARHGATTLEGESGQVDRIVSYFGSRPIRTLDAGDVSKFLTALRAEGRKPATCNRYASCLSSWFTFAIERSFARKNPVKGLRRQREELKPIPFIGDADLTAIFAKESDARYAAAYRFLADTGMRRGEFERLERRDYDPARSVVQIRKSKSGHPRVVPLIGAARAALDALLGPIRLVGPDLVWTGSIAMASKQFAKAARAAGYRLSLHALRHSCASRLAQRGIPLATIAEILGHRCLATTARYASHVPAGAAAQAMLTLERPIPVAQGSPRGTAGGTDTLISTGTRLGGSRKFRSHRQMQVEAPRGIEPRYTDLQSVA